MPERTPSRISVRVKRFISCTCLESASGVNNRVAKVNLSAAITMDGASAWANRIKMLDVETARIAVNMAIGRMKRERSSVTMSASIHCGHAVLAYCLNSLLCLDSRHIEEYNFDDIFLKN